LKLFKNGLIILLLICLGGAIFYYALRDNSQHQLDRRLAQSLELNEEATALLAAEDYVAAREKLLQSLVLNRLNAWTYGYLGYAELNLGNHQQAYECFVSTLNLEATSADLIKNLAEMLLQSGHYAEAERYLQYGLKDFPEDEALNAVLEQAQKMTAGE
jgi:tetratricopeptide (TPR) repeat protein